MDAVLTPLLALLAFAPPQPDSSAPDPAEADPAVESAPADDYQAEQAEADVEVILVDRGKAYLDARARLEAHPVLAAAAVMARLEGVPAPSPEKRDRLLNVLAVLGQPEHVELFAQQLRRAMVDERPTELWMQLLRRQGAAASKALISIVGDRELGDEQRGEALELLVELTAREGLGELMAMVGRGDEDLQDRLRRAIIRRARASREDKATIASGIDGALVDDASEEGRFAQLLILRAACCEIDEAFSTRLESLAADPEAPFQVRVAAIDGLGRLDLGAAVLTTLVRDQAASALGGAQAAEILVSLALEAMPEDEAATLASELSLLQADAPRLAALGYRYAELSSTHDWLAASQTHAWPEVRKAALGRVADEGQSCDKPTVRKLGELAGPVSGGGEQDARVGRAAVAALGRCGDSSALATLRKLLDDGAVDLTQRAEAARQLVLHDPEGPDLVARRLLDGRAPELARELAAALAKAEVPTELVRDALCRSARANPMVASTAHDSFTRLFPGESCK